MAKQKKTKNSTPKSVKRKTRSKGREKIKEVIENKTERLSRKKLEKLSKDELITICIGQNKHVRQVENFLESEEKLLDRKDERIQKLLEEKNSLEAQRNELLRQVANFRKKKYGSSDESQKRRKKKAEQNQDSDAAQNDPAQNDSTASGTSSESTGSSGSGEYSQSSDSKSGGTPEKKKNKVTHTRHDKSREKQLPVEKRYLVEAILGHTCSKCGSDMKIMSYKLVRKEKVVIPATAKIVEYYVPVYYCPKCKTSAKNVVFAESAPFAPIPGCSTTSAQMLAWIIMMKFCYHLPYTRLEKMLRTTGDYRTTVSMMSRHIIDISERYFTPVVKYLISLLPNYKLTGSDDTTLPVLREAGKDTISTARMWVFLTLPGQPHPIKLFVYAENREKEHISAVYGEDYDGFVLCDCYAGYNVLRDAILAYCWIHLRRKFIEAVPESLKKMFDGSICDEAVAKIEKMFHEDHKIQKLGTWEERKEGRNKVLKPLIDEFFDWLREQKGKTKNPSVIQAINYGLNHEEGFIACLEDPDIPLSNNISENCCGALVLGRNNWRFAGCRWGGIAIANCHTLIHTAEANGIDPYLYILYLLTVMPRCRRGEAMPEYTNEEIENLVPWSEEVIKYCKVTETSRTIAQMSEKILNLNGFAVREDVDAETKLRKERVDLQIAAKSLVKQAESRA